MSAERCPICSSTFHSEGDCPAYQRIRQLEIETTEARRLLGEVVATHPYTQAHFAVMEKTRAFLGET